MSRPIFKRCHDRKHEHTGNCSFPVRHHWPEFSSSLFFASLAAFFAFRLSSAIFFFSSFVSFFSNSPFTSVAGTLSVEPAPALGGAPGLVGGGAVPGSQESGTCACEETVRSNHVLKQRYNVIMDTVTLRGDPRGARSPPEHGRVAEHALARYSSDGRLFESYFFTFIIKYCRSHGGHHYSGRRQHRACSKSRM